MRNPFNFDKNDAQFVQAARTKSVRQSQITRLTFGRSWSFAGALLLLMFWMLMVALESFKFTASNSIWLVFSAVNLISFAQLDSQIKFLKVLESDATPATSYNGSSGV